MSQDSRHPYKADPYRATRKPPSPGNFFDLSWKFSIKQTPLSSRILN
jgi:hypothetical protein